MVLCPDCRGELVFVDDCFLCSQCRERFDEAFIMQRGRNEG
jgi:predicted amidophosphoribosyltransferase